jgi:hypothetical protein
MKLYVKTLTLATTLAGLLVATSTNADFRDYNYKAWAQPGKQRSPQSASRSRSMYRSTVPVIVRTEPAPNAVAQAPTEQRSFSYEPSQQSVSSGCGCGDSADTQPTPATAQRSTDTRRSFSYEPSMSSDSYLAPRMRSRSSQSSETPKFLLPKTDPRKYRSN